VFDFSREAVDEDYVVRTIDLADEERWVDVMHTAGGHRAFWGFSGFSTAEEARQWAMTIA
jgi:hypothetical protein